MGPPAQAARGYCPVWSAPSCAGLREQPRPGRVRPGKLGQALCSAPFYETTAGRLSQEKDDTPTPPTPSPATANPQPLERRLQRDWPVSEGTLPTPDSSWGQGLNLGGQETAESRESFSQGFGEVLGIFPEGQLCPTPAHWEGPWQGPDLGHTADSSEEGNSPFSLTRIPKMLRGNPRAPSPETHQTHLSLIIGLPAGLENHLGTELGRAAGPRGSFLGNNNSDWNQSNSRTRGPSGVPPHPFFR